MNWPPLTLLDGSNLVVSPSQLALMQRCPRQWGFKYLHRREPAGRSVSAAAGKAFHAALEPRNRHKGPLTPAVEEEMRQKLVDGFQGLEIPDDEYRNLGRYQRVLDAYNVHWRDEEIETLAVEVPIMVPVGDIVLPANAPFGDLWCSDPDAPKVISPFGNFEPQGLQRFRIVHLHLKGIVDRLVRHKRHGLVLVGDTKTTKDWRASNQVMWERASAPKAYCWGVMELARLQPDLGLPTQVMGFMLDSVVVRREASTLKRPRKEGIEDQSFQRIIYPYEASHLVEWRRNALALVKSVLLQLVDGDLVMNESACSNFYGRSCGYLDVCNEPDDGTGRRAMILGFDKFADYKPSPFEKVADAVTSEEDSEV